MFFLEQTFLVDPKKPECGSEKSPANLADHSREIVLLINHILHVPFSETEM